VYGRSTRRLQSSSPNAVDTIPTVAGESRRQYCHAIHVKLGRGVMLVRTSQGTKELGISRTQNIHDAHTSGGSGGAPPNAMPQYAYEFI
jgi:hypothetical protein